MALKKQNESEPRQHQSDDWFHDFAERVPVELPAETDRTAFHYVAPKEPIDWNSNDQSITATREIAERLGILPEELVEKPGAWIYLTEAILAWFPGTHWQGPTEYDNHEHYRRDGILEPLVNLLGIKKK